MKLLLILAPIAIGLVAAVATMLIAGSFLPRMHTAKACVHLPHQAQQVWAVITDFEAQPAWRPGVRSVTRAPDQNGNPVWVEVSSHGRMPAEVTRFEAPSVMQTRIADATLPFGGTWTYKLTPEGDGCQVCITEDGEVRPALFRYISRVMGHDATMKQYLKALRARLGTAS